ncbi:Ankyrin repeat protein 1 [Giardia muris]|uniref:Ankyrin repeat protein 1 n=1 Tax=Giardia muris TaxID=5742 RepID=A0A4Z1SU09_GIAMU|nr:Ankyrin repeat protein 1 [Giardia muris]|eukprot:TNJ28465.1 Ankyrin repeat protein 1 [Giardia muris]
MSFTDLEHRVLEEDVSADVWKAVQARAELLPLLSHPNLLRCFDVIHDKNDLVIHCETASGEPLTAFLPDRKASRMVSAKSPFNKASIHQPMLSLPTPLAPLVTGEGCEDQEGEVVIEAQQDIEPQQERLEDSTPMMKSGELSAIHRKEDGVEQRSPVPQSHDLKVEQLDECNDEDTKECSKKDVIDTEEVIDPKLSDITIDQDTVQEPVEAEEEPIDLSIQEEINELESLENEIENMLSDEIPRSSTASQSQTSIEEVSAENLTTYEASDRCNSAMNQRPLSSEALTTLSLPSVPRPTTSRLVPKFELTDANFWLIASQLLSVVAYLHSPFKDIPVVDDEMKICVHSAIGPETIFYDSRLEKFQLSVPPATLIEGRPGDDLFGIFRTILALGGVEVPSRSICYEQLKRNASDLLFKDEDSSVSNTLFAGIGMMDDTTESDSPSIELSVGIGNTVSLNTSVSLSSRRGRTVIDTFQEANPNIAPQSIRFLNYLLYASSKDSSAAADLLLHPQLQAELLSKTQMSSSAVSRTKTSSHEAQSREKERTVQNGTHSEHLSSLDHLEVIANDHSSGTIEGSPNEAEKDSRSDLDRSIVGDHPVPTPMKSSRCYNTPLHLAAMEGDTDRISEELKYAKRFNEEGKTALMLCAERGFLHGVQQLIPYEAGLFTRKGVTALRLALELELYDVADLLLEAEGICTKNPYVDQLSQTDLIRAVLINDVVAVWCWRQRQGRWVDFRGMTALMHAIDSSAHLTIVKLLAPIEGGMADQGGKTALHRCAETNKLREAAIILPYEKGLRWNGRLASELAYERGYEDLFQLLFAAENEGLDIPPNDSDDRTSLMLAVLEGDELQSCLYAAQAGHRDRFGCTALMYAAALEYCGHRPTVSFTRRIVSLLSVEVGMQRSSNNDPPKFSSPSSSNLNQHEGTPFLEQGTALMAAAITNNLPMVRALQEREARLQDASGYTALMHAVIAGHCDVVRLLAEPEAGLVTHLGQTALVLAIIHERHHIAGILAPYEGIPGVESGSREQGRFTELMEHARNNNLVGVWCYNFQAGLQDPEGNTALMYAIRAGNIGIAKRLVHEGTVYTPAGITARALAEVHTDDREFIESLPAIRVVDDDGNDQLQRALISRDLDSVLMFLHLAQVGEESKKTPLMVLAELGFTEAIEAIIKLKPEQVGCTLPEYSVTKVVWTDVTALMIAASRGNGGVVSILAKTIEAKRRESAESRTALMAAAINNHIECVRLLIPYESRIHNRKGWTALMYAAAYNHEECVEALIPAEAGLQMTDGWTALMTASRNGYLRLVHWLAQKEAGLLKRRKYPALYYAAMHLQLECVRELLGVEGEYREFVLAEFQTKRLGEGGPEVQAVANLLGKLE